MAAVASSRSDSLTRNSFKPRMRVTPSANDAATARIGYSSIIDGARSAGTSTPLSADARTRRSATSSPPSSRVATASILAPISRSVVEQSGAQRIGHHRFEDQIGAGHEQRRHQRKRRRGRIGRHHDIGRLELGLALQRDAAAVLAMRLAGQLGAEMLQQPFGVVAGGLRFDHRGLARRGQARQQHRRLELRRRHRRFVDDRDRDRARLAASAAAGRPRRLRSRARPSAPADRARAASAACARRRRRRRSRSPASRRPRRSPAGSRCRNCRNRAGRPAGQSRRRRRRECARRPRRRAPAGRRARAWPRRYAARPRLPAGRRPWSRRPSARPESGRGARSICPPARGHGPARGRRGGRSAASNRQGSPGAILNNERRPTTRPRGASSRGVWPFQGTPALLTGALQLAK